MRFGESVTAAVFLRKDSSAEFLSLLADERVDVSDAVATAADRSHVDVRASGLPITPGIGRP